MTSLHPGARQLPTQHISIRVPWHDNDWNGTICRAPKDNSSCLVLARIAAEKQDLKEEAIAGREWGSLARSELPPCISERASSTMSAHRRSSRFGISRGIF